MKNVEKEARKLVTWINRRLSERNIDAVNTTLELESRYGNNYGYHERIVFRNCAIYVSAMDGKYVGVALWNRNDVKSVYHKVFRMYSGINDAKNILRVAFGVM